MKSGTACSIALKRQNRFVARYRLRATAFILKGYFQREPRLSNQSRAISLEMEMIQQAKYTQCRRTPEMLHTWFGSLFIGFGCYGWRSLALFNPSVT